MTSSVAVGIVMKPKHRMKPSSKYMDKKRDFVNHVVVYYDF